MHQAEIIEFFHARRQLRFTALCWSDGQRGLEFFTSIITPCIYKLIARVSKGSSLE